MPFKTIFHNIRSKDQKKHIYIYIYIYIRGAKIQYPISVLLQYWHFLLDQGMSDKTDPTPILCVYYSVLLLSPTKATNTL